MAYIRIDWNKPIVPNYNEEKTIVSYDYYTLEKKCAKDVEKSVHKSNVSPTVFYHTVIMEIASLSHTVEKMKQKKWYQFWK